MTNKSAAFLIVAIISLIAVVSFYNADSQKTAPSIKENNASHNVVSESDEAQEADAVSAAQVNQLIAKEPLQGGSKVADLEATQITGNSSDDMPEKEGAIFSDSEKAKQVLQASGKLRKDLQNEAYLEIDNQLLAQLTEGDVLPLRVDALDLDYELTVKNVQQDRFGNKTIVGGLPDQDFPHSSVFTVNDDALYANIVTPTGTYSMAGDGRHVWIAETRDLIKGVIQDSYDPDHFTDGGSHSHDEVDTTHPRENGN